jgi:hypothetical protein
MTARRGQTGNAWDSPGGGISPLIANVYMNRSLKVLRLRGLDRRDGARLVNYADSPRGLGLRRCTRRAIGGSPRWA